MELTKKQRTIKYICCFFVILVSDLLQNVSGLFPEIAGSRCFLLLNTAVILAMGEGILAGSLIGLFAGLLWDMSGAVHMGFNCIFIMLFCLIASSLTSYIARDTFITNMIMTSLTVISYCLVYWLLFIVIKGSGNEAEILLKFYIPCGVYTLALSPVVWLILSPMKRKLNKTNEIDL